MVSVVAIATPVDKHRPAQDQEDKKLISAAIRSQQLEPGLVYGFGYPSSEPLLWLPDLVAGAVNRARFDELDCCLQLLGGGVTILEVGNAT